MRNVKRMFLRRAPLACAGLAFGMGPAAAAHGALITTLVARSGTAAPAGGNYSGFFGPPVLNGAGQVAFTAGLTGGSATAGLFAGAPGALQAAALRGPAPAGGNYNGF